MSTHIQTRANIETIAERAAAVLQNTNCTPLIQIVDTGSAHEVRCYFRTVTLAEQSIKPLEQVFKDCSQLWIQSRTIISKFVYV